MGRQIGLVTSVLVLLTTGNVRATIIELPLDCAGTYSLNDTWSTEFDLGVEFTDIAHVYINWEGEFSGAKVKYFNTEPVSESPIDVVLTSLIGNYEVNRQVSIWGGKLSYPTPQIFNLCSEYIIGNMEWLELFDGKNNVIIDFELLFTSGNYIEYGFVEINNAKLVVDGNLVPEPVTILLLAFGACGILSRKKKL